MLKIIVILSIVVFVFGNNHYNRDDDLKISLYYDASNCTDCLNSFQKLESMCNVFDGDCSKNGIDIRIVPYGGVRNRVWRDGNWQIIPNNNNDYLANKLDACIWSVPNISEKQKFTFLRCVRQNNIQHTEPTYKMNYCVRNCDPVKRCVDGTQGNQYLGINGGLTQDQGYIRTYPKITFNDIYDDCLDRNAKIDSNMVIIACESLQRKPQYCTSNNYDSDFKESNRMYIKNLLQISEEMNSGKSSGSRTVYTQQHLIFISLLPILSLFQYYN